MTTFIKQARLHDSLCKLACAARYIRRKRAQQKRASYKQALSDAEWGDVRSGAIGAGIGSLIGGGLGYGFGGKHKLLSTLAGAGIGAGIGGAGGYGYNRYIRNPMANISDKALAKDLRNLQGQGVKEVGEFSKRLNDAKLEGDELYAANKAFNKALGQAVSNERKGNEKFVLDKALYRPEDENDRTASAYGVGSKQSPTGNKQWGFGLTHSGWETFTPDRVESELAAMQRAEDAGNLPKGSTQEAAQNYYTTMMGADPDHMVMGGSEGIRLVGLDRYGRRMYNAPKEDTGWWGTWGSPSVNVIQDPKTGKFYKHRAGSADFLHGLGATAGGTIGGVGGGVAGGIAGVAAGANLGDLSGTIGGSIGLGVGGYYGGKYGGRLGGWLAGGNGELKDFADKLDNPNLDVEGGQSYLPILQRIQKTYGLK